MNTMGSEKSKPTIQQVALLGLKTGLAILILAFILFFIMQLYSNYEYTEGLRSYYETRPALNTDPATIEMDMVYVIQSAGYFTFRIAWSTLLAGILGALMFKNMKTSTMRFGSAVAAILGAFLGLAIFILSIPM